MKYIFFAYNYPTLCRAIKYTEKYFGKENTHIVYKDTIAEMPEKVSDDYNVIVFREKVYKRSSSSFWAELEKAKQLWSILKHLVRNINDEITFVVFKDNTHMEVDCMERLKRKFGNKAHIWLIEEGSALYVTQKINYGWKKWLKKFICMTQNITPYPLNGNPHGLHKSIEKIIAVHPEFLEEKFQNKKVILEKQIDVFDKEMSEYFVQAVVGNNPGKSEYDCVFLTQPVEVLIQEDTFRAYDEFLTKLFSILAKKGKTIIKCHPRDNFDYTKYLSDKVHIVEGKLNKIPFECLIQHYGNPRMLTISSTVCINIKNDKQSVFLYDLLNLKNFYLDLSDEFLEKNNIVVCHSFDELDKILCVS